MDYRYTRLIYNIYKQGATPQKNNEFPMERGVGQGNIVSPKLFKAVLEYAFEKLDWYKTEIKTDGKMLNKFRFADDIVLIASIQSVVTYGLKD